MRHDRSIRQSAGRAAGTPHALACRVGKRRRAASHASHANEAREEQIATIMTRAKRLLERAAPPRNAAPSTRAPRKRQPRP